MLNYNLLSAASGDSEGPKPPKQSKSAMEDLFRDVYIISSTPAKSQTDKILEEITVYKQEQVVPMSASPLIWWKMNTDILFFLEWPGAYSTFLVRQCRASEYLAQRETLLQPQGHV